MQMHIQTLRGRILETILSLRFLVFQYGIVYKLHITGKDTSLAVHFLSFILHAWLRYVLSVITYPKKKEFCILSKNELSIFMSPSFGSVTDFLILKTADDS
jgi:hypothetical protein